MNPRTLLLFAAPALLFAQASPDELAKEIIRRFESASPEEFSAIFPLQAGRKLVADAVQHKLPRHPGLARVLQQSNDTAVLLLSGHLGGIPNSGDETIFASQFSGLYQAVRRDYAWRIDQRIPLDRTGRLNAHRLEVKILPGQALEVTDTINATAEASYGIVLRLNHSAAISEISWNDSKAEYAFGGGVLWVKATGSGRLRIRHRLEVEHGPNNTNSSCFLPDAGHVRDQYFWHPYFEFASDKDRADLSIIVRIPEEFYVATSLPQRDRVENGERSVEAQSFFRTNSAALFYDRKWSVRTEDIGGLRLDLFTTADFEPAQARIVNEVKDTYAFFAERFGKPQSGYFSVVQARARGDSGWRHLTNQASVAGVNGGAFIDSGQVPRASFAHETSHAWTKGVGPGANFIQEGWATFCEALFLRHRFGPDVEKRFWEIRADRYFRVLDGKSRITDDPLNSGVAYEKGGWIFAMLERILGVEQFNKVMTRFSAESQKQSKTVEEFMALAGQTEFLSPWITGNTAPVLSTRIDGKRVTIEQTGPLFDLPLAIDIKTASSVSRQRVRISSRSTAVDSDQEIVSVVLDPDRELLIRR